jgi:hypothetical protein
MSCSRRSATWILEIAMENFSNTIISSLNHYFQRFAQQTHQLAAGLSEEQFWTRPYPYGNSFGHLVLHITGNLNHYIGAHIAQTGYVRDREREFTDSHPPTKAEALRLLNEAVAMVVATIEKQSDEDWAGEYSAVGVDDKDRFSIILRCCAHFHHHIGQMIYLQKECVAQTSAEK